ncbi:hypothetical protein BMF94_6892 [Rhodotorula taiwanensis]|uniref:Fe2OG dioxygenase domain-containing protein n=1 Tax=Rhodotorula taiwanensis TaxID=741276 RepID=A0A2S5B005_9BASI|nr:hypothetical protein BMF94_6892 [Rhodotorula taiwanensis]
MTATLDRPSYPPFEHVQPTKEDLPFIRLGVVDLSRYVEGPEGLASRQALAADLEEAVSQQGFFFLEGHGYPKAQLDYLQAVSQAILDLPLDEKTEFSAGAQVSEDDAVTDSTKFGAERGTGFKVRGYWGMQHGVRDQIEHYNWRNVLHPTIREGQTYPPLVRQHLPEVVDYISYLHYDVIRKISSLFDIILELPEGTFWNLCSVTPDDPDNSAGGFARAMLYNPMPEEDEKKTANTWLRGHSDASYLTFITSQPMASLQVRDYKDGEWKWVGYREGALVVNVADTLEFITGSFFKSTIHRVVSPPSDQKGLRRLGFIYFSAFKPHTIVDPSTLNSPKLKRLGISKPDSWDTITAREWEDRKVKTFGKKAINQNEGDEPIPFYINGRAAERWHQLGK